MDIWERPGLHSSMARATPTDTRTDHGDEGRAQGRTDRRPTSDDGRPTDRPTDDLSADDRRSATYDR